MNFTLCFLQILSIFFPIIVLSLRLWFFSLNWKKLIKKAIKNKASYIALGAFFSTKTKLVKYRANIKTLKWAKKTTNIPIVAIGGIKFDNYKKLLLNKANFLAISSYVWNNKIYKPYEAIKKLKWKYQVMKLE